MRSINRVLVHIPIPYQCLPHYLPLSAEEEPLCELPTQPDEEESRISLCFLV